MGLVPNRATVMSQLLHSMEESGARAPLSSGLAILMYVRSTVLCPAGTLGPVAQCHARVVNSLDLVLSSPLHTMVELDAVAWLQPKLAILISSAQSTAKCPYGLLGVHALARAPILPLSMYITTVQGRFLVSRNLVVPSVV